MYHRRCFLLFLWFLVVRTNAFLVPQTTKILDVSKLHAEVEKRGSYVPDGLTPEQYSKLKRDEQNELAKKDFGAWGPRFRRSSRPDGDWFVMPSLWTGGFQVNRNISGSNMSPSSPPAKLGALMRKYGPSFLLAYMLVDAMVSASALLRSSKTTVTSAFSVAARYLFWRDRLQQSAFILWNLQILKVAAGGVLTLPARALIERANRRLLWAPRRTMLTAAASTMAAMIVWAALLFLVGKVA